MYQVRFNKSENQIIPINDYKVVETAFEITGICSIDDLFIDQLKDIAKSEISFIEIFNYESEVSIWSSDKYNNSSFITLSLVNGSESEFNFTFILNI